MLKIQVTLLLSSLWILVQSIIQIVEKQSICLVIPISLVGITWVGLLFRCKQPNAKILLLLIIINAICAVELNQTKVQSYWAFFTLNLIAQLYGNIKFGIIWSCQVLIFVYYAYRTYDSTIETQIPDLIQFALLYSMSIWLLHLKFKPQRQAGYDLPIISARSYFSETDPTLRLRSLELIKEGVIIFEDSLASGPTYVNSAIRQLFGVSGSEELMEKLGKYCKIESAMQSFESMQYESKLSQMFSQQASLKTKKKRQGSFTQDVQDQQVFGNINLQFDCIIEQMWNISKTKEHKLLYIQHLNSDRIIEITMHMQALPIRCLIIVCRDVQHRNFIKQLQKVNNQKSKMISFVSHEFRTPIGCIITMLEQVIQRQEFGCQSDIMQEYLQTAIDNAKYLLNLTNDLLDLAQIKANKFTLNMEMINLRQVCQECINMFKLMASKKSITMKLDYQEQCPTTIKSDQQRIKQIIINLLGNAFKFTPSGQILITVQSFGFSLIQITVRDTGIGISDEDQGRLFKAFAKVNSEESKKLNSQGVGLGLVISNQIAQQLGTGQGLIVTSQQFQGTEFSFHVINNVNDKSIQLSFSSNDSKDSEENVNFRDEQAVQVFQDSGNVKFLCGLSDQCCSQVLVVDDNQFNIDVLQLLLRQQGHKMIDYALNGYQALDKFKNKQCKVCQSDSYQIVFMDIEMPGINGIQTTQLIVQYIKEVEAVMPYFIACSGYGGEEIEKDCKQVGIKGFIQKPVQQQSLIKMMDKLFRNSTSSHF